MSDATLRVDFAKVDEDRRLVFGWAHVQKTADGDVIDWSGDHMKDAASLEALEAAIYDYVLKSRSGDTEHAEFGTARLVETLYMTPEKRQALGISKEADVPEYGWWVGYFVDDDATWAKVKGGDLRMFSIVGRGERA